MERGGEDLAAHDAAIAQLVVPPMKHLTVNNNDDVDTVVSSSSHHTATAPISGAKLYKRRWGMLALFSLLSMSNGILWITFAPINSIAQKFYGVGTMGINSLSMIYMVSFIPGAVFSTYYISVAGLRKGLVIGAVVNVAGAGIRCLPWPFADPVSSPFRYGFIVIGQTVASIAQLFILSVPPVLGHTWFGPNERARATSIGALFNQVGIAVGFYLPPAIVSEKFLQDGSHSITMTVLLIVETGITLVICILVLMFFENRPPTPPSLAVVEMRPVRLAEFVKSTAKLVQNWHFNVMFATFGIGIGAFYAVATLLEQIVLPLGYSSSNAGSMGMAIVIVGLPGAYIFGFFADRTKRYKHLLLSTYVCTGVALLWFVSSLRPNNYQMLLVNCASMGFFMTAMLPVGMDLAVEVAYPVPEMVPSSIMMMSAQLFGTIFTVAMDVTDDEKGMKTSILALAIVLFIAAFSFAFFKAENARTATELRMAMINMHNT